MNDYLCDVSGIIFISKPKMPSKNNKFDSKQSDSSFEIMTFGIQWSEIIFTFPMKL